jgi:hypothetical protein
MTNNLDNSLSHCEAKGMGKVWMAYADNCAGEDIMEVGFNLNSGYMYIALENGVCIASILGNDVEYIVTDFNDGEEFFFDDYESAIKKMEVTNEGH